MLLESALAEFSIDLNDQQQQNLQDVAGASNYTHRVVLEMCSPSESSCELVKNSGKPITRHAGKEQRQTAGSSRRNRHNRHNMIDLSEEEEYHNCYGASSCAPFRWELQPRVPRPPKIDGDLRDDEDNQAAPIKLPAPRAAAIISSPNSTTSSASIKNNGRYFSWNLSHLNRQSINVSEGSVQRRNSNDYDGDDDDDHHDRIECDSNEECSPVSTLELPGSPRSSATLVIPAANSGSPDRFTVSPAFYSHEASQSEVAAPLRHPASSNSLPLCIDNSENKATHDENNSSFHNDKGELPSSPARSACTTLLWGVLPCSYSGKCLFVPSLKQKEKSKQAVWDTGHQGKDSNVSSTSSHCLKMLQTSQPHRPSALKKKSNRSSCCNRISSNSTVGSMKQVRFNVETGTANLPASSSSDEDGGGTLSQPTRMDSASYCLF